VTTEIQEQAEGPLAGRRVAVKDNIEVAGVPMMNGSRTLEGFLPSRDATVVTRLLAAGRPLPASRSARTRASPGPATPR